MGAFRQMFDGLRAYRAIRKHGPERIHQDPSLLAESFSDPQVKASLRAAAAGEDLRAASERGEAGDTAAYMRKLREAGMVGEETLEPGDPRLEPIDGMSFETYVALVALSINTQMPDGVEAAGAALGVPPGSSESAFEEWGNRVVADGELGVHYTAALQGELAKSDTG